MTPEDHLAPLSDEDSCGPDLFDSFDPAFETYMNDVEMRLPAAFFDSEGRPAVKPDAIDLEAEWSAVAALLGRSRDLRLLANYGQFCAVARDPGALADCLRLMADLLDTYPDDVHPRIGEDVIDRTNAIELLATRATVLMPLEFTPLLRDRRLREISFRRIALARGERTAQGGETAEDADALLGALRAAENADAATAIHATLLRIREAVARIESRCLQHETHPFRPNLEELTGRLDDLIGVLQEARPELGGTTAPDAAEISEDTDPDEETGTAAAMPDEAAPAVGRIADTAQARAALDALEAYFRLHEPSSPGLVLVRQSRQLVGRPLVEALDLLVPEMAGRARIDFGRDTGFVLTMERMRALSEIAPAEDAPAEIPNVPDFTVTGRKQATALMSALEAYYTGKEPSSPIPVLLTRARGCLNQSFTAILAEFLPAPD
jgi:type VI secretion system protein ImpA